MQLLEINGQREKQAAARAVLENLTEWFGIPEAREEYIQDSAGQICIAAWDQGRTVGFICLKETGKATLEIAVMGVLKEFHRQGIGEGSVPKGEGNRHREGLLLFAGQNRPDGKI